MLLRMLLDAMHGYMDASVLPGMYICARVYTGARSQLNINIHMLASICLS